MATMMRPQQKKQEQKVQQRQEDQKQIIVEQSIQPQQVQEPIQKEEKIVEQEKQVNGLLSEQQVLDLKNMQEELQKLQYPSFPQESQQVLQQNPQSDQFDYELYQPPRESLQQNSQQFDPSDIRYPSLHSPQSLVNQYEFMQQQQQPAQPQQQSYFKEYQPQTDQIQQFYNQASDQLKQLSPLEQQYDDQRSQSFQGSVIMHDYFDQVQVKQNEVKETNEQRLKRELEESNRKFKEQKKLVEQIVKPKTVGIKETQSIESQIPVVQSIEATENSYVIHKVSPNDTLDGISIRYNISKDLIRRANEFSGDEIYMKKELIIPRSNGMVYKVGETPVYDETQRRKEQKQSYNKYIYSCLALMNVTLMEKYGGQKSYTAEAQYYLEITNYDLSKALDEFEEDLKFEKEHNQKVKQMQKKKK